MTTNTVLDAEEQAALVSPLRRDDLVLEELDGEAVLYDLRYGAVHRFNAVTLFVWDLCDGSHTMADIAHRLTQLCEVEPDEALDNVQRAIAELRTLDLLQAAPVKPMNETTAPWWTKAPEPVASFVAPTEGPPEELRLSRRQLLRGGATNVTKLIFVAPVISTFFAAGAYASHPNPSGASVAPCQQMGELCLVDEDCCSDDCDLGVCQ